MQKELYLSGIAGSGKTEYIKKLLEQYKENALCISFAKIENNSTQKFVTIEWLLQCIFSQNGYEKKVLSDFLGIDIILNLTKQIFKKNPTLFALTKSSRFSSELYNLFGSLKNNLISDTDFKNAIEIANISDVDKNRLKLVSDVYQSYNKFLEENDLIDYRDAAGIALNMSLLPEYKFIAIDGVQDASFAQIELVKKIGNNILLCGDENATIKLTAGVNPKNISNFEKQHLEKSYRNQDIVSQALFLSNKKHFATENATTGLTFENLTEELSYIAEEIKNNVTKGINKYQDYAILTRDSSLKQKILDILKASEIPAGIEIYDENFNNFKQKLIRYLSLCVVFEQLNLEKFSKQDFLSIGVMPKSDREIIFEELDLYIENILYDTIENSYLIDRLLSIKEEHNKESLLNVVYENSMTFSENDSKSLTMEFGAISKIYELYKENRFTDIVFFAASKEKETIDPNRTEMKMLAGKIKDIEYLYGGILKTKPSLSALIDVISQPVERELKNKDFVNVLPFFRTKGQTYKYVYIPSLTEKNLPIKDRFTLFISEDANDKVSEILQKLNPCFNKIIPDEKTVMKEETALLYLGMTRAEKSLTISTHKYEDKKQIQPSSFFNRLMSINPQTQKTIDALNENEKQESIKQKKEEQTDESVVIPENSLLKLNASAIRNFQTCPKKYYFANLLNLKDKKTFSASYGSALHKIMQIFYEKHLKSFNKDSLLKLAKAYFECAQAPNEALQQGFSEKDINSLLTSDALSIAEMHENFISATEELEKNGFFEEKPDSAIAELEFHFKIDEIPDTEFDGRIDIITEKNGEFSLFDYKTGMQNTAMLSHYVSENGVEFKTKTGKGNEEKQKKEYPYQIPLYYIATQHAKTLEKYKNNLNILGLKYIRPLTDGGFFDDTVSAQTLQEFSEKILGNLKTEVAEKIRNTKIFKPDTEKFKCEKCPYEFLCDGGEDD